MRRTLSICIGILALTFSARAYEAPSCKIPANLELLSAKASEVVDVTLDANMLQFAGKFLNKKNDGEGQAKKLLTSLRGLCVRSFEFDKDGQYSEDDVEMLRSQFRSPGWSRMVGVHSKRDKENVDVYFKMENGAVAGLAVIAAESKELTFVHIDGTIDINQLSELGGQFGIPKIEMPSKSKPDAKGEAK